MAKYKLTIVDDDKVLINTIPAQPEDGYEEGTKVILNVKYGPVGNLFGAINGGTSVEIIPKAVFEVTMDSAKTVTLYKKGDEPSGVATPVITPNGGEVESGSKVTITCATEGADIYLTNDGSTPTKDSIAYEGEITLTEDVTIKAIAYVEDEASEIASASFTIAIPEAAVPTIDTDIPSSAEIPADPGTLDLTIVASTTDEGTLSYQWYKNDEAIEGATNATLTVSEAGSYRCTVTNTLGEDTATADSTVCAVTAA